MFGSVAYVKGQYLTFDIFKINTGNKYNSILEISAGNKSNSNAVHTFYVLHIPFV